jgi:hypothetical protein
MLEDSEFPDWLMDWRVRVLASTSEEKKRDTAARAAFSASSRLGPEPRWAMYEAGGYSLPKSLYHPGASASCVPEGGGADPQDEASVRTTSMAAGKLKKFFM